MGTGETHGIGRFALALSSTIDSATFTLFAAIIAEITSFAALIVGTITQEQNELRETNRKGFEPVLNHGRRG